MSTAVTDSPWRLSEGLRELIPIRTIVDKLRDSSVKVQRVALETLHNLASDGA